MTLARIFRVNAVPRRHGPAIELRLTRIGHHWSNGIWRVPAAVVGNGQGILLGKLKEGGNKVHDVILTRRRTSCTSWQDVIQCIHE